jgi:hypothetical protein
MTLAHFLGADRPLPTGYFGYNYTYQKYSGIPLPDDKNALHNIIDLSHLNDTSVQVYETELDAVGLEIGEFLYPPFRENKIISKPYIYGFNGGACNITDEIRACYPELYQQNLKCLNLLLSLIDEHLSKGESIEIYSCWDSETWMERNSELDLSLHLPSFDPLTDSIEFVDKQYITVTK